MKETIYFAGTMVQNTPDAPKEFEAVCCFGTPLPYITKSVCGLKSTAHHANLYALSDDFTRATLVELRVDIDTPKEISLTKEQQEMFKDALELGVFYT